MILLQPRAESHGAIVYIGMGEYLGVIFGGTLLELFYRETQINPPFLGIPL